MSEWVKEMCYGHTWNTIQPLTRRKSVIGDKLGESGGRRAA